MAELHDVLIRPILTEKTTQLESAGNVYAFEVGEGANKHQIKAAVESVFGVTVEDVRTAIMRGKNKRFGRYYGSVQTGRRRTSSFQKATPSTSTNRSKELNNGNKKFNPTTPSRRFMSTSDFAEVTADRPEKSLVKASKRTGGRNNRGRITSRHRGGGHKKRYRVIDFKRDKAGVPGRVASVEYDPNRSARIALIHYVDGEKRYILWPLGLEVGATVVSSDEAEIQPGNAMRLTSVLSVRGYTTSRCRLERADALPVCRVLRSGHGEGGRACPSASSFRRAASGYKNCTATIGQVGNLEHENQTIGKAGRSRWLGRRPCPWNRYEPNRSPAWWW